MTDKPGTALVTGASSGIGATYADRLARRGHDLILVARDKTRLETLAERLRAEAGVTVEVLDADLTAPADLRRVERRLRDDAAITLLVNNAGMAVTGPLAGADMDGLETMIQLNLVAATRLAGAAVDGFLPRGRGVIVNIASVLALAPEMFNAVYSATKAYLLSFTQTLDTELRDSGVRVQAVLPGMTRTEIWERSGIDAATLPPEMIMGVDDMVDAALKGLDMGEVVTIPALPDIADWEAFVTARRKMGPNLSRSHPAARYGIGGAG
ncbi:AraC family transcriptional regulator [Skermanella stibiiresistens SB22]|uniref:AraC family transcriptional regulator n=1 Tax=Skermanella stibiiresistens SB22 TaxID=1385369 RepID=W9HC46_9PROT|nr:SDR family oxidoreductase [Skermanella stibiiresistens]EWY41458.1 AraC family transcriptional regulator [Skermanella stibiiresistens SB22]